MKIGFDVDGTLTNERFEDIHKYAMNDDEALDRYIVKMLDFTPTIFLNFLKRYLTLGHSVYVITFRWQEWSTITFEWFKKHNVVNLNCDKCYFSPPEIRTSDPNVYRTVAVEYKSKIINDLGLDIYYEDSDFLIKNLTINCPNTHIINANLRQIK
jgi:hypothetical protein